MKIPNITFDCLIVANRIVRPGEESILFSPWERQLNDLEYNELFIFINGVFRLKWPPVDPLVGIPYVDDWLPFVRTSMYKIRSLRIMAKKLDLFL